MTYLSTSERERARCRRKKALRRFGQVDTDITVHVDLRLRAEAIVCPLCDCELTDLPFRDQSKEMDHIVTARNGGRHELANVRIICRACNRAARNAEHGVHGQIREFNGGRYPRLEGEEVA